MVTILAFLLTLGVLIVVHEYGHYRVAVACGVRVLRFSIGFGRVLWRRQRTPESTEFVVCVLPFGGYVRMLDEREGEVRPEELGGAFNRKPLWQRAAVVVAGPIANLMLAVALYAAAHWIGVDEPKALLGPPAATSIAEHAGMHAGDWVRAWSQEGSEWHDVRSLTDLRWQVTQAMLRGEDIDLLVSDRDGRGQRRVHLALASLASADVDAKTDAEDRSRQSVERAGARRGQGGRRGRRVRAEGRGPHPCDRRRADRRREPGTRGDPRERQDRRRGADALAHRAQRRANGSRRQARGRRRRRQPGRPSSRSTPARHRR